MQWLQPSGVKVKNTSLTMKHQKVSQHNKKKWHRVQKSHTMHTQAKKEIGTFKDHFKGILAGVVKTFPPHLWDKLLM